MTGISIRLVATCSIVLLWAGAAAAQTGIGDAVRVENRVEGQLDGAPEEKVINSPVYQNERIKTYADSGATFELIDETTLSLGAASEIVLDRFVFDPDKSAGEMVFNAVRGAFRFVSGVAESTSYKILTPVAAIGIRGTDFDVYTTRRATLVLGRQGVPFVCPRRLQNEMDPGNFACCELNTGEAGGALYGIITNRGRSCYGPIPWTGTNPGVLLERYVEREERDFDDDEGRDPKPDSPKQSRDTINFDDNY